MHLHDLAEKIAELIDDYLNIEIENMGPIYDCIDKIKREVSDGRKV